MMDGEQPPRRPGKGEHGASRDEPDGDWSEVSGPASDDGGVEELSAALRNAVDEIEYLWEQMDPRQGKPNRYNRATGGDSGMLSQFFMQATLMLETLDVMREEIKVGILGERAADGEPGAAKAFADAQVHDPSSQADITGALTDKNISDLIDLLAAVDIEVDEADVIGWGFMNAIAASSWAKAEAVELSGGGHNPYDRPFFLLEDSDYDG